MGKRGRGLKFWGRKSNFSKMRLGKNINLQGTLYTPDIILIKVGYCQGMSQIAALLLMYLNSDVDAFWEVKLISNRSSNEL